MERTEFKDGTIYIGELEFTGLMKRLIHSYQFRGNGDLPIKVVLPAVTDVEGVLIEFPIRQWVSEIVELPVSDKPDKTISPPTTPPHPSKAETVLDNEGFLVAKKVEDAVTS